MWKHCYRFTHASFHTIYKPHVAYRYRQCHCRLPRFLCSTALTQPAQNLGKAKMFDFRRITPFCLGNRFSKDKMTIYVKNWQNDYLCTTLTEVLTPSHLICVPWRFPLGHVPAWKSDFFRVFRIKYRFPLLCQSQNLESSFLHVT